MSKIIPARVTARLDGDFVVFLIGMRVNKWWKFWRWIPVAAAMPRMLTELAKQPELGLLHARTVFGFPNILVIQYWRSFDLLMLIPPIDRWLTCPRGAISTEKSRPTEMSASGMRPIW